MENVYVVTLVYPHEETLILGVYKDEKSAKRCVNNEVEDYLRFAERTLLSEVETIQCENADYFFRIVSAENKKTFCEIGIEYQKLKD